jgi:hypothetical protein
MTDHPHPSARRRAYARAVPYLDAAANAGTLTCLALLSFPASPALEIAGGVLLILGVHQAAHDVMRRRARIRTDRLDRGFVLSACVLAPESGEHPARPTGAWIGIAGPIAGTAASSAALGLYACSGHLSLLLIALVGFMRNADAMLPVSPRNSGRRAAVLWLPGLVSLGGVTSWALGVLDSRWSLFMAIYVGVHLHVHVRSAVSSRDPHPEHAGPRPRPAWLAAYIVTWLGIAGGFAYCMAALDRVAQ